MEYEGNRFVYTDRERKKLVATIGKLPLSHAVGRSLCPYCLHVEARWRSLAAAEGQPGREVRVICSQCQRRMKFEISAD